MNIKFLAGKVSNLSMKVDQSGDEEVKNNFKLSFVNAFLEEDDKTFLVDFSIALSSKEEGCQIDLDYVGIFETDEPITEKFKESHFPSVNAPAIAYPFIRSFISTVTVNSGLKPIILPTLNFIEMNRRKKEGESKEFTKIEQMKEDSSE